jgi:hypothetical protein
LKDSSVNLILVHLIRRNVARPKIRISGKPLPYHCGDA